MFVVTILLLIAGGILSQTLVIIHARQNGVKERLGKFSCVLEPGIHFLIPFFDRVSYLHEMREQVLDVPSQMCITKDNIQVEVDGLVYIKVMDAKNASYGIENYKRSAVNLAQTTMRSEIGKLTLHESFSERDSLNRIVVEEIDKASTPWGIKVLRYEIMNIQPSEGVVHTLEKAMVAERDRRAEVTFATSEKEALTLISEGRRQEAINISEGEKIRRVNEAEGQAAEINLLAEASAYGIERVARGIASPGGQKAVELKITEQFIESFGKIISTSEVTVVPTQIANLRGVIESIGKVM